MKGPNPKKLFISTCFDMMSCFCSLETSHRRMPWFALKQGQGFCAPPEVQGWGWADILLLKHTRNPKLTVGYVGNKGLCWVDRGSIGTILLRSIQENQ